MDEVGSADAKVLFASGFMVKLLCVSPTATPAVDRPYSVLVTPLLSPHLHVGVEAPGSIC